MDDIDMIRPVQAWYVDCASNLFKHVWRRKSIRETGVGLSHH
jgi:hypothetical protein